MITMTRKRMEDKVIDLLASQLGLNNDEVKPTSSLVEDLGADSLDIVEIHMGLEEEFDLIDNIGDVEAETLKTVKDVFDYIAKRVKIEEPTA